MGKNIKSYATIPCPFPREREGSLTAKVLKSFALNMVRLNRTHYSHLKFMARLNRTHYSHLKFMARLNHTHYSHLKFTNKIFQFSKLSHKVNSSELCRFRAVRPHSPRITQNSHILLTYSILCFRHLPRQKKTLQNSRELRKFRAIRPHSPQMTRNSHHLLTLYITFQMPDQWQGMP